VLELPPGSEGVLPNQYLTQAVEAGVVHCADSEILPESIQPASLDLRLGSVAYRVRCSFLPTHQTVRQRMRDVVIDEVGIGGDGAVLAPGLPYLIPLKERLDLPGEVRARANPKSSTGRVDVFTRVITDHSYRFDEIKPGYRGEMFLEVVPLSFPVLVREDLSLNQLRLTVGHAELSDQEIIKFHSAQPILFAEGIEVPVEKLGLADGLFLGLDLRGDRLGNVGYRARSSPPLLDMTRVGKADPIDYWEPIKREKGRRIVLTPKSFYLLMSYEAVTISPTLAAEMTAYDPTSGELRTHYAGFFDPGFGYDAAERFKGSTAALEVRAHDVPFMIEHGQPVCKLTFERMLEEPTHLYGRGIGSNYQQQKQTLGKHFRPAPHEPTQGTKNSPRGDLDAAFGEQLDLLRPQP